MIAVNIGNTRTQFGLFLDGELAEHTRMIHTDHSGLEELLKGYESKITERPDTVLVVSSVCEPVLKQLEPKLHEWLTPELILLERELNVAIGRCLDPETITGTDRLLNAAAAYDSAKAACVVVDAGTCITVDFVDDEGVFHGGAIMPGIQAMLDVMSQKGSALPALDFTEPDSPIGPSTVQAMYSGAYYAARGGVRELIEAYALKVGGWPITIATGGDAATLFSDHEIAERIVPELTLMGMETTIRLHREKMDEDPADEQASEN